MTRIVCLIAVTGAFGLLPTTARAQLFLSLPEIAWPKLSQQIDSSHGKLPPLPKSRVEESVQYVFAWEKHDCAEMTEKDLAPLPWCSVEADPDMDFLTRSRIEKAFMMESMFEGTLPDFPLLKVMPHSVPQTPDPLPETPSRFPRFLPPGGAIIF